MKRAVKNSLFAASERREKLDRLGDPLLVLDRHIDFAALAADVDRVAPRLMSPQGGRPPYPTQLMVRLLVLQQLFNLADEQVERQVLDRLSFQRFLGLLDSSSIPYAKTLWAFRERIAEHAAAESMLEDVQRQLAQHGYLARCGQLVDATIIEVPRQHLSKDEKTLLDQHALPVDWTPGMRRQGDVEARWTQKHGKSFFGYKLHASADVKYKFIRKVEISPAQEHDSRHFQTLLDADNTGRKVYADSAYASAATKALLNAEGYVDQVQRKGTAQKALSAAQQRRNHALSKVRSRIEHVFGRMWGMGGKGIRTIGLARAAFGLHVKAATYNLQRLAMYREIGVQAF